MFWSRLAVTFKQVFDILPQTDQEGTIREIYENTPIRGNNTWMLMCSAMLASIGLDINSVAVIIGAMLISPLMSPILGVGLSIGIHDREMMTQSLKNLSIATAASIGVSFLYFSISPLADPTTELMARTHPTLLDVGVAFFGGVAGIISISRSDKSIALPGVAIATALMPPLCTAGFGLATGTFSVFFGAFYLFFLNAVFISLSTLIIVKYLKFTPKTYMDPKIQKRVTRIMALMVIVASVPSAYFLYNVYAELRDKNKIDLLVIKEMARNKHEILKWNIVNTDSTHLVKVYGIGPRMRKEQIQHYQQMLANSGLKKYRLQVIQFDIPSEEIERLTTETTANLLKGLELQARQQVLHDSLVVRRQYGQLKNELQLLFPELSELYIETPYPALNINDPDSLVKVSLRWSSEKENRFLEVEKMRTFINARLQPDSLAVIILPPDTVAKQSNQ